MLLRLSRLLEHSREETACADFLVAVRNRHALLDTVLVVPLHPDLMIAAAGELEPVPPKDSPELIKPRGHGRDYC